MSGQGDDQKLMPYRRNTLNIEKVDAPPPGPDQPAWAKVIATFNPLGPASEAYARTLAYRLESKRLANELERVRLQGKVITIALEKSFELKMEELEQRRIVVNRYFDTVQQHLAQFHIDRTRALQMAEMALTKTLEPGLPMEERRLYKELTVELNNSLPLFADRANTSLQALCAALPRVNIQASGLLTGE